jgi:hypothetical protein
MDNFARDTDVVIERRTIQIEDKKPLIGRSG